MDHLSKLGRCGIGPDPFCIKVCLGSLEASVSQGCQEVLHLGGISGLLAVVMVDVETHWVIFGSFKITLKRDGLHNFSGFLMEINGGCGFHGRHKVFVKQAPCVDGADSQRWLFT